MSINARILGDQPVAPLTAEQEVACLPDESQWGTAGLRKRELFAAMAMQGILANRVYDPPRRFRLEGMAKDAVSAADALLAELAKDGES